MGGYSDVVIYGTQNPSPHLSNRGQLSNKEYPFVPDSFLCVATVLFFFNFIMFRINQPKFCHLVGVEGEDI